MPENPVGQFMDCADGNRRARVAVLFGNNPLGNAGLAVTPKTANYTVKAAEIGSAFSTEGAAGAVAFTLPAPFAGAMLHFFKEAAQNLTLTPAASTTINGASSLANTTNGDSGSGLVTLLGISTTKWRVYVKQGTWA